MKHGLLWTFATFFEMTQYYNEKNKKKGCGLFISPPQEHAIFVTRGLKDLQETTKKIFGERLPSSIYEHADSPELEYYPESEGRDEILCEIWIPVVKKK